jgi:hypothetical protein
MQPLVLLCEVGITKVPARLGVVSSVIECLPSMHNALGSVTSTTHTQKSDKVPVP